MTASAHRKKKAATDRGLLLQHGSSTGIWLASCGEAGRSRIAWFFFWQACCSFALTLAVTLARVADAKIGCGTSQQPAVRRALQRILSLQQHRPLPLPPPSGGTHSVGESRCCDSAQRRPANQRRERPAAACFEKIFKCDPSSRSFFFYLHFNN